MPRIRKYKKEDREAVQYICLQTSVGEKSPMEWQRHILNLYCNYYIDCEPENVFVAVDDSDRPVGYIFCSTDFDIFKFIFTRDYLPILRCLGKNRVITARLELLAHQLFRKDYPAHMHIDILPEYQKMGLGTKLLQELFSYLKEKNCPGLQLICDTGNDGGFAFYQKYGFEKLFRLNFLWEDFCVYGIRL